MKIVYKKKMIVINQTNFIDCKPIPLNFDLNFNFTITIIFANCIWRNKNNDNLTLLNECLSSNCNVYCSQEYNKVIAYSNSVSCLKLSTMYNNCIQECKWFSKWLENKNKTPANLNEQKNKKVETIKNRIVRHIQLMENLPDSPEYDDTTLKTSDIIIIVSFIVIMLILIIILYQFFTHNFDLIKSTIKIVSIKNDVNTKTIPTTTEKIDNTKSNLKSKTKYEKVSIKINL